MLFKQRSFIIAVGMRFVNSFFEIFLRNKGNLGKGSIFMAGQAAWQVPAVPERPQKESSGLAF